MFVEVEEIMIYYHINGKMYYNEQEEKYSKYNLFLYFLKEFSILHLLRTQLLRNHYNIILY